MPDEVAVTAAPDATKAAAAPAKKAVARKPAAKKAAAKKPVAKKAAAGKTVAKKAAAKTEKPAAAKKAAAKSPAKKAAKKAAKTAAKAPVKKQAAKAVKPGKKAAVKPNKPVKPAKPVVQKNKKPKLVRDSFTMPEAEYQVLGDVKKAFLKLGVSVKKSELLRASIALIKNMDTAHLNAVISALAPIKAGRPKKDK